MESFLENNKVRGAYYKNPDYIEGANDPGDEYYCDETSPKNRTFIIDNQDTYSTIFKANTLTVDFDKEIVYLYIFADVYPNRNYCIDKISVEEQVVSIYYKLEKNSNKKDATAPYQRCLIVVMKKTNTSNVEFVKQR